MRMLLMFPLAYADRRCQTLRPRLQRLSLTIAVTAATRSRLTQPRRRLQRHFLAQHIRM